MFVRRGGGGELLKWEKKERKQTELEIACLRDYSRCKVDDVRVVYQQSAT